MALPLINIARQYFKFGFTLALFRTVNATSLTHNLTRRFLFNLRLSKKTPNFSQVEEANTDKWN